MDRRGGASPPLLSDTNHKGVRRRGARGRSVVGGLIQQVGRTSLRMLLYAVSGMWYVVRCLLYVVCM